MKLSYGVFSAEIPDDCAAALGYRAIFTRGAIDIVHDRVARHNPEMGAWQALQHWYGAKVMNWLDNLTCTLRGNDPMTYALDDGCFHIRASAQASYGYLYVTVWMDAKEATAS